MTAIDLTGITLAISPWAVRTAAKQETERLLEQIIAMAQSTWSADHAMRELRWRLGETRRSAMRTQYRARRRGRR